MRINSYVKLEKEMRELRPQWTEPRRACERGVDDERAFFNGTAKAVAAEQDHGRPTRKPDPLRIQQFSCAAADGQ